MESRFPDTDWFCDNCNAYLNSQPNFDDRKYIWKCKKCGYKNSISAANIRYKNPSLHKSIGFILGITRSFLVYIFATLFLKKVYLNFHAVYIGNHKLVSLCLVAYSVIMLFSLFFERVIAKYGSYKPLMTWIISTIFVNILGDFIRPLQEVLSLPFAAINSIHLKHKGIPFKKYFHRKCLYALSYLLLLLLVFMLVYRIGI